MRILITGATGFIGSHLIQTLQTRHEIFCLVRNLPDQLASRDVQWIEQDLVQPLSYSRLPTHLDVIIHLAQSRFYRQFPEQAEDIFKVNIQSTFQLLEYARRVGTQCFIFASSGGVYGYSYERFVETDPVTPLNFYLSSKYTAELLIANYQQFFRTVVFRFFFVYGPGQQGMLMPTLSRKVQQHEQILIDGKPGLKINPIYITDAIRVFEPAFHLRTSELFNVAGDETINITGLVNLMEQITGEKASIHYKDVQSEGDLVGDNTRMKEILDIWPQISLEEGLRRVISDF